MPNTKETEEQKAKKSTKNTTAENKVAKKSTTKKATDNTAKVTAKKTTKKAETTKTAKTTAKKTTGTKKETPVKKTATKKDTEVKKTSTKKVEEKATEVKTSKAATKKTTAAKKTTAKKVEEKPAAKKKKGTKTTSSKTAAKTTAKKTTPKAETKKPVAKKVEEKVESKPKVTSVLKEQLNKRIEEAKKASPSKKDNKEEKELSVIDKIKNFIAKIAAMQQEAKKEEESKEEKTSTVAKTKKTATAKEEKASTKPNVEYLLEYYDLPYRYNETTVRILAQTPKKLFVYWDISDADREKYIKTFGDDFFYKTYPVLLVYNEDKKYVKEVQINDFANSWYVDIDDPKTKYRIQLGRKFKEQPRIIDYGKVERREVILQNDYLPFANSNVLEAPNSHILIEYLPKSILFRNVKTNEEFYKDLMEFKDVLGNQYDVKEFYSDNYGAELDEAGMFDMANPSSRMTSSQFK